MIRLNPGTYAVDVSLSGFTPFNQGGIIVEVGRVTNMDVTIGVGGQAESVSVVAQAPVINRESSDLSTNINQTSIANLPVSARRWSNFVLSTPGAAPDGTFGLISFRGISGLLNNNTVDGGDNTQAFFAEERGRTRLSYSLSLGAVQEFQVTTSNYSAEYGRAAGGVVNAVTKSGGNKVQGEGFYLHPRQQVGRAEPVHDARSRKSTASSRPCRFKPEDQRHQYGVEHRRARSSRTSCSTSSASTSRSAISRAPRCRATANAFFAPLSAAELATLAGRGVTPAAGNDGLAFMQSLTGVVARTGDQTLLLPKIDWQINERPRSRGELQPPALELAGRRADGRAPCSAAWTTGVTTASAPTG